MDFSLLVCVASRLAWFYHVSDFMPSYVSLDGLLLQSRRIPYSRVPARKYRSVTLIKMEQSCSIMDGFDVPKSMLSLFLFGTLLFDFG
jgi:hypothetical protein